MINPIFYEQFKDFPENKLTQTLFEACETGNIDIVKYVLTSTDLSSHADINGLMIPPVVGAAEHGHLEIVKYLLTSKELKENASIKSAHNPFIAACREGHLEVVRYLLTSDELQEKADIHIQADGGFSWACLRGHLDVIKYLLFSDELNEHINIHNHNEQGFTSAIQFNQLKVLQYFIFDLNIEKTEIITKYLKENPDIDVEKMFEMREVQNDLSNELSNNEIRTKKVKI